LLHGSGNLLFRRLEEDKESLLACAQLLGTRTIKLRACFLRIHSL
jgi:hypothetical protein